MTYAELEKEFGKIVKRLTLLERWRAEVEERRQEDLFVDPLVKEPKEVTELRRQGFLENRP